MGALGRTIVGRNRYARIIGLGDRRSPCVYTPCIVKIEGDPDLHQSIAPFSFSRDGSGSPATLILQTMIEDMDILSPSSIIEWQTSEGQHLPPVLSEADSGKLGGDDNFLVVSWQTLHHDSRLMDGNLTPDIVILVDAPQLISSGQIFLEAILTLRERFPSSLLWAPGISGPDNAALLSWFGLDLFDSARARSAAAAGHRLTMNGPRPMDEDEDPDIWVRDWEDSLRFIRSSIKRGNLRELVESQVLNSPRSVEHLRRHDSLMRGRKSILASHVSQDRRFRFNSSSSRNDPLVHDWKRRVADQYTPPPHCESVLLLLPCSERKPYRESQSHRRFARHIPFTCVDQVMVTSPLGLVPRSLEDFWPAAHYDIPVTGDWDSDEISMIHEMVQSLANRIGYKIIINHSGINLSSINGDFELIDTRGNSTAGSPEALDRLQSTISDVVKRLEIRGPKGHRHRLEIYRSASRFLYDNDSWLSDVKIEGRPPRWRIEKEGKQIAQWHPRSGRFAFSKSSLNILYEGNVLPRIHLIPDVKWKGDIFVSIIESYPEGIREGDDILVMQNSILIGSARAVAPGWEWKGSPGRVARSHHRIG
ncbi:MAG: DUF5591 domain-containing protein [Candidatus Thalassarchaeaceae archaeon]